MKDLHVKSIPFAKQAEEAIIGCMMLDKECLEKGLELNDTDFFLEQNKYYFQCIKKILIKKAEPNFVTISSFMKDEVMLEKLAEIVNSIITTSNFHHYLKIVREMSNRRKIILISTDAVNKAYDLECNFDDIADTAQKQLVQIESTPETEFYSTTETIRSVLDAIEMSVKNKGKFPGTATGFVDYDLKSGGMQPGDLVYIAGRPSMGKTAFMLNIAEHIAIDLHEPVLIFSLEMTKEQLVQRMLQSRTEISGTDLKFGTITDKDFVKLASAASKINDDILKIDDTPGQTFQNILKKSRRAKKELKKIGLIAIDYLQLMGGKGSDRRELVEENSRGLKLLAKEIGCPVICLSQLSRAPEQRADHRPILSDLREAGGIEQDGDIITFLYRDSYYNPETDKKNIAECIIAKNRNGSTGTVELLWMSEFTKFFNYEKFGGIASDGKHRNTGRTNKATKGTGQVFNDGQQKFTK